MHVAFVMEVVWSYRISLDVSCVVVQLIWIVTRLGILISEEAKRDAKREKLINILNLK